MICLGFDAKFLILPKHHLRKRDDELYPRILGSHTHKLCPQGVHGPVALVLIAVVQIDQRSADTEMSIYLVGDFP